MTAFEARTVDSTDSSAAVTTLIEGEANVLAAAVIEEIVGGEGKFGWALFARCR